ncbi:MAPEG family protein [Alcanivorax quisquiliarum]|uniref:MAPEG family protein n=1 Tax=Alcanivorax quisquiliarum TaxID=2933565 RepID=A0ABT0EAI3_9GAMM|nr:MAPEG family protein [Alcanivorax quisquiliarum]MCK0538758.1 MAPEG family protein [Alcanivorax quisquiliarum]
MTTAYWCLLVAIFLPYLFTVLAKFRGDFGPKQNHNPREFLEALQGARKRAHWAQQNSFEVTPAFLAAVLVAQTLGTMPQSTLDSLAIAWLISRVVFGICYIADWATLRSLVWFAGMGIIAAMFIMSA